MLKMQLKPGFGKVGHTPHIHTYTFNPNKHKLTQLNTDTC